MENKKILKGGIVYVLTYLRLVRRKENIGLKKNITVPLVGHLGFKPRTDRL